MYNISSQASWLQARAIKMRAGEHNKTSHVEWMLVHLS